MVYDRNYIIIILVSPTSAALVCNFLIFQRLWQGCDHSHSCIS